jgi:glycosyltransferase involved in cell wall biosynthesis
MSNSNLEVRRVGVAVLLTSFNHEATIEQAFRSVHDQQTDFPFQIIVYDDASTDGTPAILQRLAEGASREVSLRLAEENAYQQGATVLAPHVLGIDCEYLAFCEGDDYWTDPLKLQKQVDFMQRNPWCAVSHHGVEIVQDPGSDHEYARQLQEILDAAWREEERVDGRKIADGNFIVTCSAMIRRDRVRDRALRAVFDVMPDDWIIYSLALEEGDVGFLRQTMAAYRIHGDNLWADELSAEASELATERVRCFLGAYAIGEMRELSVAGVTDGSLRTRWSLPPAPNVVQEIKTLQETTRQLNETARQLSERCGAAESSLRAVVGSKGWRTLEAARGPLGKKWDVPIPEEGST